MKNTHFSLFNKNGILKPFNYLTRYSNSTQQKQDYALTLQQLLENKKRIVVMGPPGSGKTQLSLYFAEQSYHQYEGRVQMIDARTFASLKKSYMRFGKNLGIEDESHHSFNHLIRAINQKLMKLKQPWLIIFDNATIDPLTADPQIEDKLFLPALENHFILVISNFCDWSIDHFNELHRLEDLTDTQVENFILTLLKRNNRFENKETALEFAQEFDKNMLAMKVAIEMHYREKNMDVYLKKYRSNKEAQKEFLACIIPPYNKSVSTAWRETLDCMFFENNVYEESFDILKICALFAADNIPKILFSDYSRDLSWTMLEIPLHAYCLIRNSNESEQLCFDMPRVLQLILRIELEEKKQMNIVIMKAVQVLINYCKFIDTNHNKEIKIEACLFPHVKMLIQHINQCTNYFEKGNQCFSQSQAEMITSLLLSATNYAMHIAKDDKAAEELCHLCLKSIECYSVLMDHKMDLHHILDKIFEQKNKRNHLAIDADKIIENYIPSFR